MIRLKNKFFYLALAGLMLTSFSAPAVSSLAQEILSPDDLNLGYQYYLNQIDAFEAWKIVNQSSKVVVAIIDSGVDIDHPDLAGNIWHNQGEVKDGQDNDHNGYIDDLNGWDFVMNNNDPRPKFAGGYTSLGINHGTLVAGVIGAVGNNHFGIAGLSWKIQLMPLRVMDAEGSGNTNAVFQAIKYAITKGADIINMSMVGQAYDPLLEQVISEAYEAGVVIVAAAGNETVGEHREDLSLDLAAWPQYPICHDGPNGENYVLGVGAVDKLDVKSRFSNYGSRCLDLVAPGEGFWGVNFFSPVVPGYNKYFGGYWSGTSLAAPLVSGTAALVKALRPDFSNKEIYDLIKANADNINGYNPKYTGQLGAGRLNLLKVLKAAGGSDFDGYLLIAGASAGLPEVKTYNYLGLNRASFLAYQEKFSGGVNLTSADIDSDGSREIITAAGLGGGPHVRIFKQDGTLVSQFFVFDKKFSGGVNITSGDLDGDGVAEIICAPMGKMSSLVRIFDWHGALLKEFSVFEDRFKGGVNLSLVDLNADGIKEIAVAAGVGRGEGKIKRMATKAAAASDNSSKKNLVVFISYDKYLFDV